MGNISIKYHMGWADWMGMTGIALENSRMGTETDIALLTMPMERSGWKVITLIISGTDILLNSIPMEAYWGNGITSMVCSSRASAVPLAL